VHQSFVGLLGRLIISMGVVMAVMVLAAKVMRNRNFGGMRRPGSPASIEVLARQPFGKGASVAVVRAGGKELVIGVTESSVTVLAEADPKALADNTPESSEPAGHWTAQGGALRPNQPWKTMLEQLRERTVRR
jgi:flagellar biogenesis protein FliO